MKHLQRVSIIGSGNLAEALARAIDLSDLDLVQIIARNEERGKEVARLAHTSWCNHSAYLLPADIYIISVSDRAVREVAEWMPLPEDAVIAHTAGSVAMDVLPARFAHRAVFYPLQTFTKGRQVDFREIPIFLETSTDELRQEMEYFAHRLAQNVYYANTSMRTKIHLAGVFTCNFANYMYTLGEEIVHEAGVGFDVLRPIIRETAAKAAESTSPIHVQTGPAVRHDLATQERHQTMLSDRESMLEIYQIISQNIWETSKKI